MRHGISTACVCSVATLIVVAGLATAGPLDPPAGSIGPTYKTLSEVEPRTALSAANTPGDATCVHRITQPGSYYLTGNIDVPNNVAGIEIAADNVTIDLNGFTVKRTATGASARSLIRIASSFNSFTTVRNGSVVNSGLHGLELGTAAQVERVRVIDPAGRGITTFGSCNISDCFVTGADAEGVYTQAHAIISRTTVANSGAEGIAALSAGLVADCTVTNPVGVGILAGICTTVERCVVEGGDSWGISASLNTPGQVFRNNTLYMNAAGGIRGYFRSLIEGNTCDSSNLAVPNIYIAEQGNRVRNNHCTGGTDGVKVDTGAFDNIVTCNSSVDASVGNGFANIPLANNQLGPIVSAAGSITSTSPWANFSR